MEKLYKISKINEPENYCSEINGVYLLKSLTGKSLRVLCEEFYQITKMLMDYNSLNSTVEYHEKTTPEQRQNKK